MVSSELIQAIRKQYALSWLGIRGAIHWARVMENGLRLAESTRADLEIVKLLAVFHDACRWRTSGFIKGSPMKQSGGFGKVSANYRRR
jgi:HD superfamily phosphohydrolase YqeK